MFIKDTLKHSPRVDFNLKDFQELIRTKGVLFTHYSSCLCPNIKTIEEHTHHANNCSLNCEDGLLYIKKGIISGVFSQDYKSVELEQSGEYDSNSALATFNTFYSDSKGVKAILNVYDKLLLNVQTDVVKKYNEYIECSELGTDRLSMSPISIDYLISGSGKVYEQGTHFIVENSYIKWIKDKPTYHTKEKRGEIYSISYFYYPVYFVKHILHELRIIQTLQDGVPLTTQFPMQVSLFKDFICDQQNDTTGLKTARSSRRYNKVPR